MKSAEEKKAYQRAYSQSAHGKERRRLGREKWNRSANGKLLKFSWQLQRRYKITLEEFDAIWISQNYACGICQSKTPTGRGWHVDHDHITGKFRGILCLMCNLGVGYFRDAPDLLLKAVKYLNREEEK